MNKLTNVVEIVKNDDEAVVLKVKEGSQIELLSTGCFNGNEKLLVISKVNWANENLNYTIVYNDDKTFSFSENTLVSDATNAIKKWIYQTVVFDFGIPVNERNYKRMSQFNFIKSVEDDLKHDYTFELAGFSNNALVMRKEGCFVDHFSYDEALDYLNNRYRVIEITTGKAVTGCDVYTIKTKGRK